MLHWDNETRSAFEESRVASSEARVAAAKQELHLVANELSFSLSESAKAQLRRLHEKDYGVDPGCNILDELIDIAEAETQPGAYDVLMGYYYCLENSSNFGWEELREVFSHSYQAILDVEILSKLTEEVTEAELASIEKKNDRCIAITQRHLGSLGQL